MEMNTSLAGYDELLFSRLKRLIQAMEASTSKNVRQLSQRIQFSTEAGSEIGNIARSLGMGELNAQMLADQMSDYLREITRSIEGGRIAELGADEEAEESFEDKKQISTKLILRIS